MYTQFEIWMAAMSYNAYRPDEENEIPVLGWTRDLILTGENRGDGFDASVYVNGNEVAIAFRGTDTNSALSMITDFWTGNLDAASGAFAEQVMRAIEFVADVRAKYPGANISLTG